MAVSHSGKGAFQPGFPSAGTNQVVDFFAELFFGWILTCRDNSVRQNPIFTKENWDKKVKSYEEMNELIPRWTVKIFPDGTTPLKETNQTLQSACMGVTRSGSMGRHRCFPGCCKPAHPPILQYNKRTCLLAEQLPQNSVSHAITQPVFCVPYKKCM